MPVNTASLTKAHVEDRDRNDGAGLADLSTALDALVANDDLVREALLHSPSLFSRLWYSENFEARMQAAQELHNLRGIIASANIDRFVDSPDLSAGALNKMRPLDDLRRAFQHVVDDLEERSGKANLPASRIGIQRRYEVDSFLRNAIMTDDGRLALEPNPVRVVDSRSALIQLREIFVREDYYFRAGHPAPYIIDAGSHCGLSLIYFKSLYPQATITAFEPTPAFHAICRDNIEQLGLEGITLVPKALSNTDGVTRFFARQVDPMSSGLFGAADTEGAQEISIETCRLSEFLDRRVDFLKLDVEGAEVDVLEECQDRLDRVESLFIEVHDVGVKHALSRTLSILENAKFQVVVQSQYGPGQSNPAKRKQLGAKNDTVCVWGRRC